MRELLIQFIVPLTFLAIWALTSILNRDAQPLPQRPRRPGDRGPGPGPNPGAEARQRRERARAGAEAEGRPSRDDGGSPAAERPRPAPARPAAGSTPVAPPSRPTEDRPRPRPIDQRPIRSGFDGEDAYVKPDEVVFLDPTTGRRLLAPPLAGAPSVEPRSTAAQPRQRKQGRGRRDQRGGARNVPVEPETPRALSDQVGHAMELRRNQRLEFQPLAPKLQSPTFTPISLTKSVSQTDNRAREPLARPAIDALSIQDMLSESKKLREIAVLSEILQPPVSHRPRRWR